MDQYNNHVDKEVWVPAKAKDWLGTTGVGTIIPMPVPLKTETQYAIAFANGSVGEERYKSEGLARGDLMEIRNLLKGYGVDEDQWPVLMERTVETVASSWRILSV